jgi:hypothetical protein
MYAALAGSGAMQRLSRFAEERSTPTPATKAPTYDLPHALCQHDVLDDVSQHNVHHDAWQYTM